VLRKVHLLAGEDEPAPFLRADCELGGRSIDARPGKVAARRMWLTAVNKVSTIVQLG
jgi:hypothetical protein